MAKTKTENESVGTADREYFDLVNENKQLKQQAEEVDSVLLLAHRLCWLIARTTKSATQKEAYRNLDRFRKVIGLDRAEKLESEWRGVTVKLKE